MGPKACGENEEVRQGSMSVPRARDAEIEIGVNAVSRFGYDYVLNGTKILTKGTEVVRE